MANGNGETIKGWWPVLVMITGLAVTWGSLQSQVQVLAEEVKELKVEDTRAGVEESENKVKVEVLATKQQAILDDVKEIKDEQKEQGEQLDRIERLIRERE